MEWYLIVLACVLTALAIRLDSLLIGPYFAFQALVHGWEGIDGTAWYESEVMRWAVIRRFAYPLLLGMILSLSSVDRIDVVAAGVLTAGLLIWPAVFRGLPARISRTDWEVPAVFFLLVLIYAGCAFSGWALVEMMRSAAEGDLWNYFFGLLRDWLITGVLVGFGIALFRGAYRSIQTKQVGRRTSGQ